MAFLPKNFSFPQVIKSLSARLLSTLAPFLKPRVLQRTSLRYLQLGPTAATYFVDFSSSRAMSIVLTLFSITLSPQGHLSSSLWRRDATPSPLCHSMVS